MLVAGAAVALMLVTIWSVGVMPHEETTREIGREDVRLDSLGGKARAQLGPGERRPLKLTRKPT
jgi:hypothetical protein